MIIRLRTAKGECAGAEQRPQAAVQARPFTKAE